MKIENKKKAAQTKDRYGSGNFTAANKGLDAAGGKTALGLRQMPRRTGGSNRSSCRPVMSLEDSLRQASVERLN
jgi:hypothetical protein